MYRKIKGIVGILLLTIGTSILAGGLYLTQSVISLVVRAQALEASVVSVSENVCRIYECYRPVVSYTLEGKSYEVVLSPSLSYKPVVGSKIAVYVDPKDLQTTRSQGFSTWMGSVFINFLGFIFLVPGFFLFRSSHRSRKP